jgi:hypothetical protein
MSKYNFHYFSSKYFQNVAYALLVNPTEAAGN